MIKNKIRALGYQSMISENEIGFDEYFSGDFSLQDLEKERLHTNQKYNSDYLDHELIDIIKDLVKNDFGISIENIQHYLDGCRDYHLAELLNLYLKWSANPDKLNEKFL
jgi:hypothetical protein